MGDVRRHIPEHRTPGNAPIGVKQLLLGGGLVGVAAAVTLTFGPITTGILCVGGFAIYLVIAIIVATRQVRRAIAEHPSGVTAIARGDLETAHAIFWRWSASSVPRVSAISRHNLAWTVMRQGELQHAVEILNDNERHLAKHLKAIGLFATSAADRALNLALLGNLTTAEKWLTEAEARRKAVSNSTVPAVIALVRAVIACRSGKHEEAVAVLDERWAEYEGTLTGETLRLLRVVRAFAVAAPDPRNAGLAETALAAVRPAYPSEYRFLGKAWPEMATFLASHGL
jgi:hypothetical protein